MSIRIDAIPSQCGTRAVLLGKTWREGRRVRHKTVASLSGLDPAAVDGFRAVLRGGIVLDDPRKAFAIRRSLPADMSPPRGSGRTSRPRGSTGSRP